MGKATIQLRVLGVMKRAGEGQERRAYPDNMMVCTSNRSVSSAGLTGALVHALKQNCALGTNASDLNEFAHAIIPHKLVAQYRVVCRKEDEFTCGEAAGKDHISRCHPAEGS